MCLVCLLSKPGSLLVQNLMTILESSFTMLLLVVVLYCNWELITPYVSPGAPNPFAPLLFISHRIPTSPPDDPRYAKGYLDLVFIAYYVVFWSWFRQVATLYICWPLARWFGVRKTAKLARFGEQGYAVLYFAFMGTWGIVRVSMMSCHVPPTYCSSTADNVATSDVVVSHGVLLDWYARRATQTRVNQAHRCS